MNAKMYLIVYYSIAGVIISLFTAVMTYYIIDVPIGQKMTFKIFLTILATLPIIGILSYLIGACLSRRLAAISHCLNEIHEDKFLVDKHEESITDISEIHHSIHQLSNRLEDSISKLKHANTQLNNMILSLSHDIKTQKEVHTFMTSKNDFADLLELAEEDARSNKYLKKECDGVELVDIETTA